MDQLVLPVDVVGHLLLLLSKEDTRRVRCVCQSWKQAVDHELRGLQPLYLPPDGPTAVFSSCERVQLPVVRLAGAAAAADPSPPHASPAAPTAAPPSGLFSWQAPMRNSLGAVCSAMQHAAEVDLTGQALPSGCVPQLVQHLTRLGCLTLDACSVHATDLRQLARDAAAAAGGDQSSEQQQGGLSRLSLAGVRVSTQPPAQPPAAASGRGWRAALRSSAQALAAAAASAGGAGSSGGGGAAAASSGAESSSMASTVLAAVASNPLTHLNLQLTPKAASASASTEAPAEGEAGGIPLLGCCGVLAAALSSSLVSLNILHNPFDADDWGHICQQLPLLRELHVSWDDRSDKLSLDAECFASISKLRRLQTLGLHFTEGSGVAYYEPYTLAPLAQTLTALDLSCTRSLPLMLSITDCSNLQTLKLTRVTRAAGTPEMLVEVVCSLPLLRELHLASITGRIARMWPLGDYVLSQLDCCCPHLTKLVMRDAPLGGTGIRIAATSIKLALPDPQGPTTPAGGAHSSSGGSGGRRTTGSSSSGGGAATVSPQLAQQPEGQLLLLPGSGALRRLKHLEINMQQIMCSTLPHLSYLTALESLSLCWMATPAFTHACRYDCFRFASALTRLTSLSIVWSPHAGGARAAAAGANQPQLLQQLQLQQQPLGGGAAGAGAAGNNPAAVAAAANGGGGGGEDEADEDEEDDLPWDDDGNMLVDMHGMPLGLAADLDDSDDDDDSDGSSDGDDSSGSGSGSDESGDSDDSDADEDLPDAEGQPGGPLQGLIAQVAAGQPAAGQPGGGGGAGAVPPPPPPPQQQQQQGDVAGAAAAAIQALIQVLQQAPGGIQANLGVLHGMPGGNAAAAAVMAALQQQQQGAGQQAAAGQQRPSAARQVVEPHLHFLARLPNLVFLNLSSLETRGACLLHLATLTRLQTLILSGPIQLTPAALQLLRQLRLPSVKHLSLTNVAMDTSAAAAAAAASSAASAASAAGASLAGASSSNSASGSSSEQARLMAQAATAEAVSARRSRAFLMDRLVPVLCAAFPSCEDLRLGSCSSLSIVGLSGLLQDLPKLQRLWLVAACRTGTAFKQQQQKAGGAVQPVPFNVVPAAPVQQQHEQQQAKKGGGAWMVAGSKQQKLQKQQQKQQQGSSHRPLVSGHVLPYDPSSSSAAAASGSEAPRPQSVADFEWFLEHAVVAGPADGASGPGCCRAPATAAAAAEAADVPEGAVRLPCVAVGSLTYVSVAEGRAFTRYLDRMLLVS